MKREVFLSVLVVVALCADLSAQTGRWVEYDIAPLGTGTARYDRGDGCLIYTRSPNQYVLIFDVRVGEWLTIDLGAAQSFQYLETSGDVAMAWSDQLLVGYSSVLGSWDSVSYSGIVLFEDWKAGKRSYGCSEHLAFFATDERLYVFEDSLGYWQDYAYTLPVDFPSGSYYAKNDYIALIQKKDYDGPPTNVVYSAHTDGFNELEYGGLLREPISDHGFVSVHDSTGYGEYYILTGYSAFTNQFSQVRHTATDEGIQGGFWPQLLPADEFTTYGLGFRRVVTPYLLVTCNFWGYDTYHGEWIEYPVSFDWTIESYYGNIHIGGQFAVDFSLTKDTDVFTYYFYSGVDGVFREKTPGITYKSTNYAFVCGGTVYVSGDSLTAWGYDLAGDNENSTALTRNETAGIDAGEDWVSLMRCDYSDQTTMDVFFYNGNTNSWSSVEVPYNNSYQPLTSAHSSIWYNGNSGKLLHYSSHRDQITTQQFPAETYVYLKIRGDLSYARSDGKSYLIDALSGAVHEKDFEFSQNGLGTHSAAFYDTDTKALHGYSTVTDNWTSQVIVEDLYICLDTGYVGGVTVNYGSKIYAYNGFKDSWVPLVPEGSIVGFLVGKKTMLSIRSTKIYAFDPEGVELACCTDIRGNANGDAEDKVNIGDVTYLIGYLFGIPPGPEPPCRDEGNTNGDAEDKINIGDITYLIDYLFGTPLGPAPPACP